MGIELHSQILSLNTARRCHRSETQLVPGGARPHAKFVRTRSHAQMTYRARRGRLLTQLAAHALYCGN
jgi:hypothetical protein